MVYYLRHENFDATGRWLSETLRTFLYHHIEYIVFTRSLEEPLPSLEARLPITYRVAEPGDMSYLPDAAPPSEIDRLSKRLAHGRICSLALYQDNLAAYIWASDEVNLDR